MKIPPQYDCHNLDEVNKFYTGWLPDSLFLDSNQFESLWEMHPSEYHVIRMHCGFVKTPRWQQAYARDYQYTGRVNRALPTPKLLEPLLSWAKQAIDEQLNGILVNWYEGKLGHYIGKHRDSLVGLVKDAPIVTISFGEERVFRLRPWHGKGYIDFPSRQGSVFIEPFETNLHWTHEVPAYKRFLGRRISVTLRAFVEHSSESEERLPEIHNSLDR